MRKHITFVIAIYSLKTIAKTITKISIEITISIIASNTFHFFYCLYTPLPLFIII